MELWRAFGDRDGDVIDGLGNPRTPPGPLPRAGACPGGPTTAQLPQGCHGQSCLENRNALRGEKTWNFLFSQYSKPSFGGYNAKEKAGIVMAGLDLY